MGIRGLCSGWAHSEAFRFSARSKLTTYLVKASVHTRREPRCFRRDRLILTPKSGLVVGIRDLCASYNVHKNAVEEAGDGEESDEDLDGM